MEYNQQSFETDIRLIYQNGSPDAVFSIMKHGNITLPWLIAKLEDQRPMERGLQIRNSQGAFEEYAMYLPPTLSDAVRHILTRMTGFADAISASPQTAKERAKGIQQWRVWYRRHRRDLKWIPIYAIYDWRGRDEFEKKRMRRH